MAAVDRFKSAIIRIRDILRTMSITGMDSMRHICLYIMARSLTREKAGAIGLPVEFAWESIMETLRTRGMSLALEAFRNPSGGDCLVNHFDRLFGTDKFPFDINKEIKHKEILEALNDVNLAEVDCEMDILGWVYEQHLQTGSKAARDLGQFFTDRSICTYMVDMCKPKFKSAGVPETVCDPTMGTGGFLTTYVKFFNKTHPGVVNWTVQEKEIHGCDTDPKVAAVSRLNFFLETQGSRSSNLLTQDSLYEDLPQTKYDVILANMPFGVKGLKYAECCARVKALHLDGTKSEPLFLQLMLVSLALGGRCAVVVPDGMLFNTSKCHNGTRKYLLDHFDKVRVIKMEGKFFMNTGIKPSILYFENTGSATTTVEFWEAERNEKGEIRETLILSVPRSSIDDTCSLDVRRHIESEKPVANLTGFPMVKLSDVSDLYSGKANRDADSGDIPFFASSGSVGKRDKHNFEGKYVITARTQSIGSVSYYDGKLWASDNTILLKVKDETVLTSRFLYYWLMLNKSAIHNIANTGLIPLIRKSDLAEIKMPIPPLPIQEEIVATLDRIYAPGTTDLADTLKMTDKAMDLVLANPAGATLEPIVEAQRLIHKSAQMVADVKAQMVAIVTASLSLPSCTKSPLSTIAYINPTNLSRTEVFDTIQYIELSSVSQGRVRNIQTIPFAERPSRAQRKVQDGDIVWGSVRPLSKSYAFITAPAPNVIVSSGFVVVRSMNPASVIPKFLYYALTAPDCVSYLSNRSTGSSYPAFNADTLASYEVTIPPLKVQMDIVARLDTLQVQIDALETMQCQSEDNARFILESYLPTGSTTPAALADADTCAGVGTGAGAGAAPVHEDDEDDGSALGGAGVPTATMPAPVAKPKGGRKPKTLPAELLVVDSATLAEALATAVVVMEEPKPKRGRKPKAAVKEE